MSNSWPEAASTCMWPPRAAALKTSFAALNPGDDVAEWVVRTVETLGAGWCPPGILGIGVGGTAEKAMLLAKESLLQPIDMAELLARSDAALRRYFKSSTENPVVVVGPLSVDLVSRAVLLNQTRIKLTRKEYRLLHVLAVHVGLVVTHDQLLKEIWTGNQRDNIQYLRILVRKLRQKIETDPNQPRLLVTESGVGYRLENRLETSVAD